MMTIKEQNTLIDVFIKKFSQIDVARQIQDARNDILDCLFDALAQVNEEVK